MLFREQISFEYLQFGKGFIKRHFSKIFELKLKHHYIPDPTYFSANHFFGILKQEKNVCG